METKTMGAFIAALRKANGLTQRELAEKLNVSDKAVSRWERDENAPDIMLIPVIAEIFSVTTDELLKGERIDRSSSESTAGLNQKIEKQIKTLTARAVTKFKSMCIISIALSFIGIICLFAISYGCNNPIIGFSADVLLAFAGAVITLLALLNLQSTVNGNEIFEKADESITNSIIAAKVNFSFTAVYTALVSICIGLPFIIYADNSDTLINFNVYIFNFVPIIFAAAALLLCVGYPLYKRVIFKCKAPFSSNGTGKLNITQLIAMIIAIICHEILFITIAAAVDMAISSGYRLFEPYSSSYTTASGASVSSGFNYGISPIVATLCGALIIIAVLTAIAAIPFFAIKATKNKRQIILSGCRNAALLLDVILTLFAGKTTVLYKTYSKTRGLAMWLYTLQPENLYNTDIMLTGIIIAAIILIIYFILKHCFSKSNAVKAG